MKEKASKRKPSSSLKKRAIEITKSLEELYPYVECGLKANGDSFRLLIMAILSAQTTDARVNMIAPALFERFPDAKSIADSEVGELEAYIKTVGLFNTKAKNIRNACKRLVEVYDSKIPSDMDELLTLGGVGRKVANLIRGDVFGLGGIVADTHCIRISNRLGLVNSKDPRKVELGLDTLIPKGNQSDFCHRIVIFGRQVCKARNPMCSNCGIFSLCKRKSVIQST